MVKLKEILSLLSLAVALVGCSSAEFSQEDLTGKVVDKKTCLDERCSTYRISENAFNPAEQNKTDILFVFDNSLSMKEENLKLADKMNGFIADLNNNLVDYNLCYTLSATDDFRTGRVLNWSNGQKVLNSQTANLDNVFYNTIDTVNNNTSQTTEEQPIAATSYILSSASNSDCFRSNTPLSVVFLTDEDENSCGDNCDQGSELQAINQPENLIATAAAQLGNVPFFVHSIIAHPSVSEFACYSETNNIIANTHARLSNLTDGIVGSICAPNYANLLSAIGEKIQDTLDSVVIKCDPISDITLTADNGMSFSQELKDGRLYLTPGIPANVNVTIEYDCQE